MRLALLYGSVHYASDPTGDWIDFFAVGGLLIKGSCAILDTSKRWAAASPSGGAANYSAAPSPRAAEHCGDRHSTILSISIC